MKWIARPKAMLLSVERPNLGSLCLLMTKGHVAALHWSGASSPAGVGLEHGKRIIEVPQELGRVLLLLLVNSRLETPGYQLQALAAHSSARERTQRVKPRYRQAKETKCGEMAVGCRSALIVPLKLGNSPWRTQWRKAKRRPADSIEGNMLNTSRFLSHVNVTRLNSFGDREEGEAVGPRNRMP